MDSKTKPQLQQLQDFIVGFIMSYIGLYLLVAFVTWDTQWYSNFFHYQWGHITRVTFVLMTIISLGIGGSCAAQPMSSDEDGKS